MRSPADMDILVVDITNRCFLACSNCTRAVAHQVETREMSPDYLREALRCLKDWYRPGKVIGLIGGEPTMHSRFEEMCRVFQEEINPEWNTSHGREPIADFNQFAIQRLNDRFNGRGLWTSFGPKFREHMEIIYETFSHWNPNDHSQGGVHQTALVDAHEMCERLGIPWSDFPKYRDACWVQNTWSGSVTPKGNYFCEHAGTLDLLYNNGIHAWKNEPGWWKRTPDQFHDQLHLCEMCALCLPGPSQVDAKDKDILGEKHLARLQQLGSPAVKRGKYEKLSDLPIIDQRVISTKDNYVGDSGIRVADGNKHVRPKKLSCVVVAVGCDAQIAHTLQKNLRHFDQVVVVTDELGLAHPSWAEHQNLNLVRAPSQFRDEAFNKGCYLNLGLNALDHPEWVVFTDADIVMADGLKDFFFSHSWNPGCLYYTSRIEEVSPGQINREPNGFFQLWNPRARVVKNLLEGDPLFTLMPQQFCSAGGIDSWFMQQWPEEKRVFVPEFQVTHLDHGAFSQRWNGQKMDLTPKWRQVGLIWNRKFLPCCASIPLEVRESSEPIPVRLTDTMFAHQVERTAVKGDMDLAGLLEFKPDGTTIFDGKDIGIAHIHVAMRF